MSNDNRSGAASSAQKSHADLIAEMRWQANQPVIASGGEVFHPVDESDILDFAKDLESAHKRELDAKDSVIQALRAELRQAQEKCEITIAAQKAKAAAEGYADGKRDAQVGNAAKLCEALTKVKEWMERRIVTCGYEFSATLPTMLEDVVLPALAAPARICDVLGEEEMVNMVKSEIATHVPMATDHERKIAEMAATAALATAYATAPMKETEVTNGK